MNAKRVTVGGEIFLQCEGCGKLYGLLGLPEANKCCKHPDNCLCVKCVEAEEKASTQQVGGTHYLKPVQPWDLMKVMESSGSAFVDTCRCNAIKYVFRKKIDMLEDLKKARHYLDEAIKTLEK